jgi:photosystem II stability/assembly factor-like uncharacterized protein
MKLFTGMLVPLIAALAADNSFAQSGWIVQVPEGKGYTLNGVSALDAQTAIAVGDYGTILRTTDGGANWIALPSETSEHLRGVSFIDAATATAVGDHGTILRTTDGGDTWTSQDSGLPYAQLNAVSFTDADTGNVVGFWSLAGMFLRTVDGGQTWTFRGIAAPSRLFGVAFADADNGVAVGTSLWSPRCPCRLVLQTTDGGATWIERDRGYYYSETLFAVAYADANLVVAIGADRDSLVERSADGGASWYPQYFGPIPLGAISFGDRRVATAVGRGIVRTTDGGAHWASQDAPVTSVLNGVAFVDADVGIAVGQDGVILRTETGGY